MREDYEFDVFLSYRHTPVVTPWVVDIFYIKFCAWLSEKLGGRPTEVFIDKDGIQTGNRWPNRLREAIRNSRCLVPIWSPSYFQSHWCVSEWQSFCARDQLLGLDATSRSLVVPAVHNDGEFFPEEAREIQSTDFSDCRSSMPAFIHDPSAVIFEQKLELFTEDVANTVNAAPPYQHDWPVVEGAP